MPPPAPSDLGRRGSEIAHALGPDGGFAVEFVSSAPTKFKSSSRHVEREGCQTACWSHGTHPHRQARPRMLGVREATGVARCDRVRRSGINLVVDGSHPPRSGADSEAPFHGDQHGSHFGSSHFRTVHCFCVLPKVRSGVFLRLCEPWPLMPRKGWSTVEVPDGRLQVIRGP